VLACVVARCDLRMSLAVWEWRAAGLGRSGEDKGLALFLTAVLMGEDLSLSEYVDE
jgi:hypothetical protein